MTVATSAMSNRPDRLTTWAGASGPHPHTLTCEGPPDRQTDPGAR